MPLPIPTAAGIVTVLLLVVAPVGAARANDPNVTRLRVFEFTSLFELPQTPGRLDGLMASDGSRHRIAIYWIEPYIYRESDLFLRYADFIVTADAAHYWIHGPLRPGTFRPSSDGNEPLLPRVNSAEAVARSALAIMRQNAGTSLEMGKFFRESRNRAEYKYEVPAEEVDGNRPPASFGSDVQIMNAMPYGREYLKAKPSDGAVGWRLRRALDGQRLAAVRVKPREGGDSRQPEDVFDPNTLGQWALVPEAYRAYWSFDKAYLELNASLDRRVSSRQLFDKIGSYLNDVNAPAEVCRGLDRLRFKTALETGDANCVWQAAQAAVAGLCADPGNTYQCLLQLGSMSGKIDKLYPQGAEERLRLLVEQAVKHAGSGLARDLDTLMQAIDRNRWLTYRKLVLEETAKQGPGTPQATKNSPTLEILPNDATR